MEPYERVLNSIKMHLIGSKKTLRVAYAKVLFSVAVKWTEEVSTAGISVNDLYINPVFFMSLTKKEQEGLIAHEALHLLYRHPVDFKTFKRSRFTEAQEHQLWNEAGDYRINYDLRAAGYRLPQGGLYEEKYDDAWSTLGIYKDLHQQIEDGDKPEPTGTGDMDIILPEPGDQAKATTKNAKIIIAAAQAVQACSAAGSMPGQIRRIIEETKKPKIDFYTVLANYMNGVAHTDYSMRRPNRRYWPELYLPSLYTEALENITCIFDLSGSVTKEQAGVFKRSIRIMKEQLQPESISLLTFDTELSSPQDITSENDIDRLNFTGGGGTAIKPVIDWISDSRPRLVTIFTDGHFYPYKVKRRPDTNIVWIIHDNPSFTWPYGKVIHHRINT